MWKWWIFTLIHNCVWIFWFVARNVENLKRFQNVFQWTTKHVFGQDNFLHMWPTLKARHFEPIEHNFFVKWLKKWVLCLVGPFPSKFQDFDILYDLVFHQIHPMNKWHTDIERACFSCVKSLKSTTWFYAFLLIPFLKSAI